MTLDEMKEQITITIWYMVKLNVWSTDGYQLLHDYVTTIQSRGFSEEDIHRMHQNWDEMVTTQQWGRYTLEIAKVAEVPF